MAQATSANRKIAIIGAGHIGMALRDGLVKSGINASSIALIDKDDSVAVIASARIVFLAVRPSVVPEALAGVRHLLTGKTVVSLAAGVSIRSLKALGAGTVARIMPNMPIAVGQGVIGFFPGNIGAGGKKDVQNILNRLGLVVEAKKESELDTLTLVAGCGPGIVAYFVEMMAKSAKSERIAFQTFKGTLEYMQAHLIPAAQMQESVATKGGVTEAILTTFKKNGLDKKFQEGIEAGKRKIKHV